MIENCEQRTSVHEKELRKLLIATRIHWQADEYLQRKRWFFESEKSIVKDLNSNEQQQTAANIQQR